MPIVRLNVETDLPDSLVPDLPLSIRREFAEIAGFEKEQATGTTEAIPSSHIATPKVIIVQADKAVTVTTGTIALDAGGFIIIVGGTPATNPPTVNNASGSTAKVRGVVLGS